jgi:hypothetical protein
MVCPGVEGSTGTMGRIKVRRLERIELVSDNWTDGRGEVAFAVCEVEADWIKSRSTGETLLT